MENNKLFLHICCASCLTYPLKILREEEVEITGFWYNPNIHPYTEYSMRLNTLKDFAERQEFQVVYEDDYDLEGFIRQVVFRENNRCPVCYYMRLKKTVIKAKELGFSNFSTTMLVSPYQKHEMIKNIGNLLADEYGIFFYYRDFRPRYREGVSLSKEYGLYRQRYCGCIYSEKERYWRKGEK
ncbi:MAG TPA: epoxyqueuosine reductase QueH [Dictyoglomaceae bacterium]|nr:epoxyqueuosine reductase QueH [Dictyoglomaceae bacterium]HOL39690.1 epoxyqueuosine reductase QueH [Dictyoglomaceae bacterium]HPP16041.1 epoxyqueuosine reductase QueH [Dictyoglomaceae bacterium]